MNKEKIEKIIEKWGVHTSEGGIYWHSHEEPHPLKGLVDELVSTIMREAVEDIQKLINQSDNRSAMLEVSEDSYVSGLEDALRVLQEVNNE